MAAEKKAESKVTLTLVVEFETLDEDTIECVKALVDEARNYADPVKADLSGLPSKMSFL